MAILAYDDVITDLRSGIEQAITAKSGSNSQQENAWRRFMQLPTGTEAPEHATIQSGDVNSSITAVLAQMVVPFGQDSVVEFEANSEEDEVAARAESNVVNRIAIEKNGGFQVLMGGIQNALLYRKGYIKCWWAKDINRYMVTHQDIGQEDLPIVVEGDVQEGLTVERRLVSYDEEKRVARVEVTETRQRLTTRPVANERFFLTSDWDEPTLEGVPLCGEVHYLTRNDLVRMGCKKELVDQINATTRNSGTESTVAKRVNGADAQAIVKQMDICRAFEAYAWLSFDEDEGRAYLYKCWLADTGPAEWLLDPEPVSRVPYACGSAFPIANRHEGEALADKLAGIEDGKTELLRQWIDNVRNCSYGRIAVVTGQANADDVMKPKAGSPIRVKSQGAVTPIPVIDVGASIATALAKFDEMRTERGGAALDMVGAEMQVASDSAHGTERVYAARELLVAYMTKNLAESLVRDLFLLAHAELRDGDGGPISLKIAGKWQQVDPSQWPARTDCNADAGMSMGERMQILGVLGPMIDKYVAGLQMAGGEMFTLPGLYKLVTDYMRTGLISNPEGYFIDPSSEAAQAAGKQKQEQAELQAKMANDAAQALVMIPEQIKALSKQQSDDKELAYKYFAEVLDASVKSAQQESQGVIDLARVRAESQASANAGPGGTGGAGKAAKGGNSAGSGNKGKAASGNGNGGN